MFQLMESEASVQNFAPIRVADHFANLAVKFLLGDFSIFSSEELFHSHLSHAVKAICLHEAGDEERWKGNKGILFSSLRGDVMLLFPSTSIFLWSKLCTVGFVFLGLRVEGE